MQAFFPAVLPLAVGLLVVPLTVAYVGKIWFEGDIGLTTLMAALVTAVLGAIVMHSDRGAVLAIIVGGAVTVLLSVKGPVHEFADRIESSERRASVKFILVVLVVFPALPDRSLEALYGLNPRFIWLMVVFVTGLGFVAYVLGEALAADGAVSPAVATTGIVIAAIANTLVKAALAWVIGTTPLARLVSIALGIVVLSGLVVLGV